MDVTNFEKQEIIEILGKWNLWERETDTGIQIPDY